MKMKSGILLFIFLNFMIMAQDKDEPWFFDEAEKAINKENYEYAL
jgi:hypothetical protein